jgi:hypothetical protein
MHTLFYSAIPETGTAVTVITLIFRINPLVFCSFFPEPTSIAHSKLDAGTVNNERPRTEIVWRGSAFFMPTSRAEAHLST